MKISTKSQYGLRAMVYLSIAKKISPSKSIAREENIPSDYLEKIMAKLEKAGYIGAKKGSQGGYFLVRKPKEIKVGDIIRTLEGEISLVKCLRKNEYFCSRQPICKVRKVWEKLKNSLNFTLNSITLADVSKRYGKE